MNRKLEFRVWDGTRFYYASAYDLLQGYPLSESCCFIDDITFQQYTGLKDKNGVKIFEDDVVEYLHPNFTSKQKGKVVFYESGFRIHNLPISEGFKSLEYLDLHYFLDSIKIVGNSCE